MQYPVATESERAERNVFRGLDDCLPDVKYVLPKCDAEVTMRKMLAETAQQFCRDTGCFQYTAEVTLVTGVSRYVIPLTAWPADILTVRDAKVYQTPTGGTESWQYDLYPEQYTIEDPTEEDNVYVNLASPASGQTGVTQKLKLGLSLIPWVDQTIGDQAYGLPDKLIRRWRAAFVAGAVARLANMDGKAWSNKALADDMRRQYMSLQGEASAMAQANQMRQGGHSVLPRTGWF